MIREVLIVDPEASFLKSLKETLEEYSDSFSVKIATGLDPAKESLARAPISLVLIGINGSRKQEGLALLEYIRGAYPEIPVLFMGGPGQEDLVSMNEENGVAGWVERRAKPMEIAKKANNILKRESDAGSLHGVSPGMFLQLIEMEGRSCLIRLQEPVAGTKGLLFFQNGELIDARVGDTHGPEAAYRIFSWDEVALAIQAGCPVKEKKIHMNAQAVLLEAMRRKDESAKAATGKENGRDALQPVPDLEPPDAEDLDERALSAGGLEELSDFEAELTSADLEEGHEEPQKPANAPEKAVIVNAADLLADDDEEDEGEITMPSSLLEAMDPLEAIRYKLDHEIGPKCGLENIATDNSWDSFVTRMQKTGEILGAGKLLIGYIEREDGPDCVVMPGESTTVLYLNPRCPKSRIIQVLTA